MMLENSIFNLLPAASKNSRKAPDHSARFGQRKSRCHAKVREAIGAQHKYCDDKGVARSDDELDYPGTGATTGRAQPEFRRI